MEQYETLDQIKQKCKVSRTMLDELIKYEGIEPAFTKGKGKYYPVDLIVKVSEKYKTINKIVEENQIDLDYRTIFRELNIRKIKPNFEHSTRQYFEVKVVLQVSNEILDRFDNPDSQKILPLYKIAEKLNTHTEVLIRLVKHQKILPEREVPKGKYYDVEKIQSEYEKLQNARKYFKSVGTIAKEYNINKDLLHDAVKMFNVVPKYIHDFSYYDEKDVLDAFKRRRGKIEEDLKQKKKESFYDRLHPTLQQCVDEYLDLRENELVISYGQYKTRKEIAHPEKNLPAMKTYICSALYKIAVYRLEKQKKEVVNPVYFDITTINKTDYIPIKSAYKNSTQMSLLAAIKPFLMHLLANAKEDALKTQEYSTLLSLQAFELGVETFLVQFPRFLKEGSTKYHPKKMKKSFLSRDECIQVYELLLTDPRSKYPLRNATMWVLGTALCIRPLECHWLRLEYFNLNSEGLLAVDKNGWGKLDIPPEASKMGISPSNEYYQTPIPPDVVKIINNYLLWLYLVQGKHNSRGIGYMFRRVNQFPETGLSTHYTQYIKRIRSMLKFLNFEQQEDFELKASRRTMNNLFVNSQIVLPQKLRGRIAEISRAYQMRHKIAIESSLEYDNFPQGEVGETYYTAPISKEDFYTVLDYVLGFPWDQKKLILWEIEKGYRDISEDIKLNFDDFSEKKEFERRIKSQEEERTRNKEQATQKNLDKENKLIKRLNVIDERLRELKNPSGTGIEFENWRKEIVRLKKEQEEIKHFLNNK